VQQAPRVLDTLRLAIAYRPARHFSIWGAATANVLVDPLGRDDGFRPGYDWSTNLVDPAVGVGVQFWPGFAVGFEF
ncbi:MAG: hypothetical protein KC457_19020, partial [Myxococcales bacterium]|nr:hypothetical protein [Myxococcales bacterium]